MRSAIPHWDIQTRILEGPESVQAAAIVRERREAKNHWPYTYLFPPPGAIRVTAGSDSSGTLIVPAAAVATQGLLYTVDQGFQFALEKLVVVYIANGVQAAWNPGDALWSLTVNRPVGVTTFQGESVQGFTNVDVPLGTLQIAWPLECPDVYSPNDALRIVFTNVNLTSGAGNYFKCLLIGWRWPHLEV